MIGIYGIYNNKTDKWYVGSTTRMENRFREHQAKLRSTKHHNAKLQNAYNKYGKNAFEYHVLATYSTDENLDHYEMLWTISLDALHNGYVLKMGNRKGTCSEETRKKLSDAKKGNTNMKGKKKPPLSEETRKKMSESSKGNTNRKGKTHSEETRKNMSDAQNARRLKEKIIHRESEVISNIEQQDTLYEVR